MSFEKLRSDESGKPNVPFSEEEVLAASSSLSEDTASGQMVSLWLADVLTNGVKKVVGKVVSSYKHAFVEGRQILDVILIANEAFDSRLQLTSIRRDEEDRLNYKESECGKFSYKPFHASFRKEVGLSLHAWCGPLEPYKGEFLCLESCMGKDFNVSSPSDLAQSFGAEVHYQTCAPTHSPVGFEFATEFSTEASAKNYVFDSATDVKVSNTMISDIPSDHMSQHKEPIHSENVGMHHIPEEQKGTYPSMGMGRTSEDGYNWRKYGQKKIIYKGGHNHPKPLPSRRSALGSTLPFNEMSGLGKVEDLVSELKVAQFGETFNQDLRMIELVLIGGPMFGEDILNICFASQDDGEDGATQGSISLGDDADDEGHDKLHKTSLKLPCHFRKKENCMTEKNLASRTVREPRVVVQVECESDVLNDGYRWRKNYYKCTSTGCSVRRHVERASNNQKSIIATYEGKHNHEVPAARNSSHVNSSGGNLPSAAPGAQSALALHRNANAPRPEALLQDLVPHFDIKPEFSNQYIRHSMLGNFANDMKFGPSSLYSMQFPPLQNTMLYAPFGLDSNNADPHQPGSVAPVAPDFPISLPLNLPPPANLGLPGFDFNSHGNPIGQVEPYFVGQQLQENDMRFLHPKEEKKDDIGDATTSCSSSTIYH
ncbi:WRKY transcription factor SUSIBA2 [Vitis vinifera]|uniref:WRKY transcription factor SUSIBA2 n=1 Tax=Vitis vinifera TaxID=29760 RepID=A0A438JER0_VITVI|nr:WRKY transcription factor SUSIBA2 [Vitis vinifera]